jgi:acetolactate synthase-1/2/3 large subunit
VEGRALLARIEAATRAPAVILESPRGIADATLGAFPDLVRRADLIVLIGKALDFTTRWASGRGFDPAVRLVAIDPEAALVERAANETGERLALGAVADARHAAETLIARASGRRVRDDRWLIEARTAIDDRPAPWQTITSKTGGRLHPAEVFRVLRPYVERDPETVLICDGGEFAQWGQSMLPARRRLVNGVAGSIGGSLSFALTARLVAPTAPIFAVLGDGTIGFHLSEFETGARRNLPFVAVLGNDACWNAESQIQLREYGRERMHGCTLTPARYDLAVAALGGHGELVERAGDLPGAIDRALASGKPACINVMTESIAAPAIRNQ